MKIDTYLKTLIERGGSDLHLKFERPPLIRIKGDLIPLEHPPLTKEQMEEILFPMLTEGQKKELKVEKELDFSFLVKGLARFRCNFFYQLGNLGAVFRAIPERIKTIDELGLPPILKELVSRNQGLILITGPTGSGKSTTLAAMVEYLNETIHNHIVTIEDPIEFVHKDNMCTINQREVGTDTYSFSSALKRALRQDPDVIMVGEMRDPETIHTAITAAETGHLVLSTLHTTYAKQSVSRIIDAFPPDQHHHIRVRTSVALAATIAQKLVKRSDGNGRIAVMEIMINTPTIKKLIAEDRLNEVDKIIADSANLFKMQTQNQHLLQLVKDKILTTEDALHASNNPNDLKIMLQTQAIGTAKEEAKKPPFESTPSWMKTTRRKSNML
ncbi:MAG: type IV pilus twitching motility protein PilT [Thermodesulfovibrionales bacterium]|nr:type IV pilus twitching motility protein PilT [Thermodesulfovibrionales bacterium]